MLSDDTLTKQNTVFDFYFTHIRKALSARYEYKNTVLYKNRVLLHSLEFLLA